jgi:branched-chain amino acid transport system ATP-binding protein
VTARAAPQPSAPLLTVEGVDVAYGDFQVLWQAAMHVGDGEIVAVLGPNGAGKSTLMNTISGLITPRAGRITFSGTRIDGLPAHRTAGEGLAHVLERRRLFPFLTVLDNVVLGAHNAAARPHRDETLKRVEGLFPVIAARQGQLAHTLSGGEQQMVAIARGLMARPRLLMIDEPFLGLAPKIVEDLGGLLRRIRDEQGIGKVIDLHTKGWLPWLTPPAGKKSLMLLLVCLGLGLDRDLRRRRPPVSYSRSSVLYSLYYGKNSAIMGRYSGRRSGPSLNCSTSWDYTPPRYSSRAEKKP